MVLKEGNPVLQVGKGEKVVWGEHFSLEDGEIDFDLIQPTGMDRKMHDDDVRPLTLETIDGGQPSVGRPVVENPEDSSGGNGRVRISSRPPPGG